MKKFPCLLYSAAAVRELEQLAINECGISGYDLMNRAGAAVLAVVKEKYPQAKRMLVCCGAGNNGGDGYVVARLAQRAGYAVDVVSLVETEKLAGDARRACLDWCSLGLGLIDAEHLKDVDVVVDALFGTGLQREVTGVWRSMIEAINASGVPVVAVDIPSGLSADTGTVMGVAVHADVTVTFIGLKQGLFTHQAADYCGEIVFEDLSVPAFLYQRVPAQARLLCHGEIKQVLKPRQRDSHKNQHGHVLVIGGDVGMAGAARLAAEAALRAGAGLVSVVTRPEHVAAMVSARPELMVWGSADGVVPQDLLHRADVIAVGPGLGQDDWGRQLLSQVLACRQAKVVDADALKLLTRDDGPRADWILTPHPGEAAHLLGVSTADVQVDRCLAARHIQQHYGGVVVLKGAGSLVRSAADESCAVCPHGNPGMAVAGMGDVLTGVIAALAAQGCSLKSAAELGVLIHALAGDRAATAGERGLLASDLFACIRTLVNGGADDPV
ncbi:MAG: ADP-dependent NAD(P)H-hydrate dehydratase / NAD(P)H-hydrate epimerase [Pseudomonadota bacterium]|nr:ADP-dependent NAD(P)H-hydrate dehydratase / NAD(P)H-hydrate epimerase [Pseudomonadota bacterium]